jgi:hypothetical protein
VGGELLYLPVLFVAAWRLRAMRPGAPSFLRKVLWFHLAFGAIALLGGIWTETLRRATDEPPGTHGEAAMLVLVVGAIAFEILSLRWLYRHRETLPLAFHNLAPNHAGSTSEIAGSAPGPRAVPGIPYPPESARHATLAAVLTAVSLLLGLPLLSGALMAIGTWLADERQARFGGLGPVELAIVLALGGLILGLAGTGTYLGLAARRQIAAAPRGMHGLRRATFALLAWPLVVLSIAGLIPIGRLFYTSYYGLLLGLGTSMVLAEVYCRFAWRWVRGAERADSAAPRGCPAWMRGFGVAGMIAAAVVVTPVTALSLSRQIRASLPPPIHVLRGDPAAAERPADARGSLQFGLASAPRSIVYVETTLLREGVLHTAPISTCHVLNTALENAESSLLLRVLPPQPGALDAVQWEWLTSAGDSSQTYRHVDSRTAGIAWAPVAIPQRTSINVGAPFEVEILRGRGADGATWTVHLRLSSEALVPGVPVGGAVVGEGRSWSDTAHRLHPEPR